MRAPLLGSARNSVALSRRGIVLAFTALALSVLAALGGVLQREGRRGKVLLGATDPFLNNFLAKSKNTGLSEHSYVQSWVKQVKHGGLFHKLHSFERNQKQQRKAWRDKQLSGITEPTGSKSLFNELMKTRSRAVGADSSRAGADRLQQRTDKELGAVDSHGHKHALDFGAFRRHADNIAPKYAGKRTLPVMYHEIPEMDSHVGDLMHELGEAHQPKGRVQEHAQLKQGPTFTTQLAERARTTKALPSEEVAVEREIASAKSAVCCHIFHAGVEQMLPRTCAALETRTCDGLTC
jgi:hypothetical protein